MKTKALSLLAIIVLISTQCIAQSKDTVEVKDDDISNNLDLQAVASIFGDSKDLEEFERKLNDYDNPISNLDLNNDGEIDYLRVVENSENGTYLVLIQAVLGKDVYQDVASIVVSRKNENKTVVQVVGDPYLYGTDYIIEPVYVYTPSIFSFFWGSYYRPWYSPCYWGYYPGWYRVRHPFMVNVYLSNVRARINFHHHYYVADRRRAFYSDGFYRSMSRNDYGSRYPERHFSHRNEHARNYYDIQVVHDRQPRPRGWDRHEYYPERHTDRERNNSWDSNRNRRSETTAPTRTDNNRGSGRENNYTPRSSDTRSSGSSTVTPSGSRNYDNGRSSGSSAGSTSVPRSSDNRSSGTVTPSTSRSSENRSSEHRAPSSSDRGSRSNSSESRSSSNESRSSSSSSRR